MTDVSDVVSKATMGTVPNFVLLFKIIFFFLSADFEADISDYYFASKFLHFHINFFTPKLLRFYTTIFLFDTKILENKNQKICCKKSKQKKS